MVPIPEGVERSDEEPEAKIIPESPNQTAAQRTTRLLTSSTPNLNPTPAPVKITTAANAKAGGSSATELPQGTGIIDTSRMTLGSGDQEDEIRG